ncbi:MAG TPA: ATP-binding protein [Acidimicrobiales bacterium]|nr:ATP-binding protein [Acidimicrobiales bacterium]
MASDDLDPTTPASPGTVGRVIGTEDATPLEYWVGIADDQFLQLDDVVALDRTLPDGQRVELYGMVEQVRARHEGAQYDSDVFLIEGGLLPAQVSRSAKVITTRVEPEVFVPPLPGTAVRKATGDERGRALHFDDMVQKVPAGLSRDGEPFFIDKEFLDGSRGAHVNISGVSGVATKTTYATFLLYSLFHSGALGAATANTKALIFNVKGEDLLFLDHHNARLDEAQRERYGLLGLQPGPFRSVGIVAPPRPGDANATPQVGSRASGVAPFFWTIAEFCKQRLLPFLFADAEDDRQQYTMVVHNVARRLEEATPTDGGGVVIEGQSITRFRELVELVDDRLNDDATVADWAGRAIGGGTVGAFVRRLFGAVDHLEHLIRADVRRRSSHPVDLDANQVTVVDIHNLNDRAKRFVVGVVLRQAFQAKEASGTAEPLQFVVLDELNKYAPREGTSPIKELLLDVAERGRSLGIILIGAQQTASEVERRVVANSAIRVVGRLDSAEATRGEYGWLPVVQRQRSTIIKPGTMIVSQPQLPVPVVVEFPFPAWATRFSETDATTGPSTTPGTTVIPDDPFEGL